MRIKTQNDVLPGVQALRNMIMANSIFISGILIFLGLITDSFVNEWNDAQIFFGIPSLGLVKISLQIGTIFFCLFSFIMAVWHIARTSLLITSNPKEINVGEMDGVELTIKSFKSGQRYWMAGIRGIFFMIAAITWLLNPLMMMIMVIVFTLYLIGFHDVWNMKKQKAKLKD
jgi:uncharacterized membrane protein